MDNIVSRLGILVFFDPDGVVDDYVCYLLKDLRPNLEKLVVVSNGYVDREGRSKLERCCDELFIRDNRGLDAAAFKEAMIHFCGWNEVDEYDEVVLLNDTFFGPIGDSFEDIFQSMQEKDVDFWGLSCGYPATDGYGTMPGGYLPAHIQTYFTVFRKNMVNSLAFHDYWYRYDTTNNDFVSVVTKHELIMTSHFEKLGFRWAVYAEMERYHSALISENFTAYYSRADQMLRYMRFPFLKKKTFSISMPDYLYMSDLEELSNAMEFIRQETDYDVGLIWQNILRRYNTLDLYHSLHLNYILPTAERKIAAMDQAAVVCFLSNPRALQLALRRLEPIASEVDVHLIVQGEVRAEIDRTDLENRGFYIIESDSYHALPMEAFVQYGRTLAERYAFLGFLHDSQNLRHVPLSIPESETNGYLENVAASVSYISQVLTLFAENKQLGLLAAPFPIHQDHFSNYGGLWGDWYPATEKLTEELELKCRIDSSRNPLAVTGAFWCRTKAVADLWKKPWTGDRFYEDPISKRSKLNEALIRVLPFAAQSSGYYSGIVMSSDYASMRLTTQEYMLDTIVSATRTRLGCYSPFLAEYLNQLNSLSIGKGQETVMVSTNQLGVRGALGNYVRKKLPGKLGSAIINIFNLK